MQKCIANLKYLDQNITIEHFNKEDYIFKHYLKNVFYEEKLLNKIKSLNLSGTYVDIGANIGNHSIFFLNFTSCKNLIAIEGHPETFELLKHNLICNNNFGKSYTIYDYLIGDNDKDEVMIAYNDMNNIGTASILNLGVSPSKEPNPQGAPSGAITALMDASCRYLNTTTGYRKILHTIDNLKLKEVTLIKIDVEGYEYNVLRGALETIKQYKPIIFVELASTNPFYKQIFELLSELKYETDNINYAGTPTLMFWPSLKQ